VRRMTDSVRLDSFDRMQDSLGQMQDRRRSRQAMTGQRATDRSARCRRVAAVGCRERWRVFGYLAETLGGGGPLACLAWCLVMAVTRGRWLVAGGPGSATALLGAPAARRSNY
jgi:hypothetical protein